MPREDITFQTSDNITLRGWFYTPEASSTTPLPCLVISHGFTAVKEMLLDIIAAHFTSALPISCLVYDHRGFGASDNHPSAPRLEIIPSLQCSDISDAITYAQGREDVNKEKIGIWGTALSGGHALTVGAVDRRVKAVLSQVPVVSGWENFHRLTRPNAVAGMNHLFQEDRLARAAGKAAGTISVVDPNPMATSALQTVEANEWLSEWAKTTDWKNEVTLKSMEGFRSYNPSSHIHQISPTPLLMTVVENDTLMPTDLALAAYSKALEPKELQLLPGSHFSVFGSNFEKTVERQVDFLKKTLCA
ncbi:carbohydrate esterase family 7 protein [Stipitochalara longipes BDJ]|nr:carbohydrate esterase family 7 protein [Stipitochalara longipes BDJ]